MLLNQWITRWRQGFQTRPFPCDESTLPDRFADLLEREGFPDFL